VLIANALEDFIYFYFVCIEWGRGDDNK